MVHSLLTEVEFNTLETAASLTLREKVVSIWSPDSPTEHILDPKTLQKTSDKICSLGPQIRRNF